MGQQLVKSPKTPKREQVPAPALDAKKKKKEKKVETDEWEEMLKRIKPEKLIKHCVKSIAELTDEQTTLVRREVSKYEKGQVPAMHLLLSTIREELNVPWYLNGVAEQAKVILEAEKSICYMLQGDNLVTYLYIEDKEYKIVIPSSAGVPGDCLEAAAPVVSTICDRSTDVYSNFTTTSILACPIQSGGKPVGVLQVINKNTGDPFSHDDEVLIQSLSHLASRSFTVLDCSFEQDEQADIEETLP